MKTIFLVARYGKIISNILRTDLLPVLKEKDVRIVLLSPMINGEFACQEFADDKVILERSLESVNRQGNKDLINTFHLNWLESSLLVLRNGVFTGLSSSANMKLFHVEKHRREALSSPAKFISFITFSFGHLIGILGKRFSPGARGLRELFKKMNVVLFSRGSWDELFVKYKPSLVFSIHSQYNDADTPYLRAAVRHKVPSIVLIQSWDNLTSKGEIAVKMDKLIVWNEIMKKEAVELHNYSPEDVYISGPPQFDVYFQHRDRLCSRSEFFDKIGADPERKLITYTVRPIDRDPYEWQIVDILSKYIEQNKFIHPSQLLVRPRGDPEYYKNYDRYHDNKNVIIDSSPVTWDFRDAKMEESVHLAETLLHSDVIVNVASTITLEASIFDTPVVNIGFDGRGAILKSYELDHYRNIVATGGIKIARNGQEMLEHINAYLEHPQLDSEGRRKILEEQFYFIDGRSGERVAKYILGFLDELGLQG